MGQSLAVSNQTSVEETAWELFETGSYEGVIGIAKKNPNHVFLNHLSGIAEFESGSERGINYFLKGSSVLTPLVEAYLLKEAGKFRESAKKFREYFRASSVPVAYSILRTAILVSEDAVDFKTVLDLLAIYKARFANDYFCKTEFFSNYHLRNYKEAIQVFGENAKRLSEERDVMGALGLALVHLGKFDEAKSILEKIPGYEELPTFEEKKKEFSEKIASIPKMEAKRKNLSVSELIDLGFAYLFSENFKKAEEVFGELIAAQA
ncbi:tetratricopeptide repeat protein [Leptospira gomenensis]|uniref:Tetratricopeptide repeat protein n=1 Tax=Leptospira gomenensis TaxID=2484974 RepID=A0A5F1YG47_9LEPT|nr:tetratricopeptide repeat protein [Leptospira gomenensis]TGK37481.1 tetratricopeptide repeat protein [Leptospira gomenensis]TGK39513.1 tetratricopeptide repeat protein [Leptospira gomenensis]TGK43066.1 tetratricopeptide repeat protein [Leptospira gomenensis]TGK54330.1 tetratricopeptide repeat protein [Leptospira gomenensis]